VTNVQMLRSMRVVVPALALTGLVWLVMLATNLLVLRSLGLDADARAGGLVLALVYLGVAPALMPGNFGPFYFFAMLGLTPFGIPEAERGAFAVLLHALVTLPPLVLAGGFVAASRWIEGLVISVASRSRRRADAGGVPGPFCDRMGSALAWITKLSLWMTARGMKARGLPRRWGCGLSPRPTPGRRRRGTWAPAWRAGSCWLSPMQTASRCRIGCAR
jgi:hypothetical protein